jgi:hypothetical protein
MVSYARSADGLASEHQARDNPGDVLESGRGNYPRNKV